MSTAAEAYAARHDAEQVLRRRLLGEPEADRWGGRGPSAYGRAWPSP